VGEGGDEVSVARFIADQRTEHQVPHAFTCRVLGVSASWFYKWLDRPPTARQARRAELDAAVNEAFKTSKGTYGSPRIHADLVDPPAPTEPGAEPAKAWRVSVNTVADSMRRQGLLGRKPKRRKGLTRQDRTAPKFLDLLKRDFTAPAPNRRWVGDMTEIPTDEGKLYLATVLDLFSRRLLAAPTSEHPDAQLACDAIKMATATRGGRDEISGVAFHTDRGSTYAAGDFTSLCAGLGIQQSMGRVGSCFDNAAAESFFSTLEWEVLSRHHFDTREQARQVVTAWAYEFYNTRRRHSSAAMMSPTDYENSATVLPEAA
jgi:putative transposase